MAYQYLDGEEYSWSNTRKVLVDQQLQDDHITLLGYINSVATAPTSVHQHENTLEVTYISKGQQRFYIGSNEYQVFGGELFVMPPNIIHSTGGTPVEKQEMFWFHINLDKTADFLGLSEEAGELIRQRLCELPVFKFQVTGGTYALFSQMLQLFYQNDAFSRVRAMSALHQILLEILSDTTERSGISPEIQLVIDYVDANVLENISISEMADIAHLSPSRFKSRFRQEVGIPPREYFNFKKIEKAKELLRSSESPTVVTDTATSLRFSTSAYFSVVFKKFTSLTPTEYLQKFRGEKSESV